MGIQITGNEAVELITEELDRLGVKPRIAYTDKTGKIPVIRMTREVHVRGPKNDRIIALMFNEDGSEPDVLVTLSRSEPPIRELKLADVVKMGNIERL